jgi:L-ribulose-5-phosphate 3-epimerase
VKERIGFMQGRLSPLVDGKIQAFPWQHWREEFALGAALGFRLMEWTLDQARLYENPLLTAAGQQEIRALCAQYGFAIPSLTGDCFMQAPFWKRDGADRAQLQRDFAAIVAASAAVGIGMIVVPLVDDGRLENASQEDGLIGFLAGDCAAALRAARVRIVFESDFAPQELRRFIERLDPELFGINYDIGNSAGMGFDPGAEFAEYGHRIVNVHIKDRVRGGTTVPLGTGSADFATVFTGLARARYRGNYILQTARAADGDHAGALARYRDLAIAWETRYAA